MPVETIERPGVVLSPALPYAPDRGIPGERLPEEEIDDSPLEAPDWEQSGGGMDSIFGRCPACGKPLRPRDRNTGEPKAPPIGQGVLSRAKCDRCHQIIEYVGNGEWVVWDGDTSKDPPDGDR